jgi:hypothetical protein
MLYSKDSKDSKVVKDSRAQKSRHPRAGGKPQQRHLLQWLSVCAGVAGNGVFIRNWNKSAFSSNPQASL